MPLLDHFRPPLSENRGGDSFLLAWAAEMLTSLNRHLLPAQSFAEIVFRRGGRLELEALSLEAETSPSFMVEDGVLVPAWVPPAPAMVIPAVFPDEIEVQVYSTETGPTLVAAVMLVSPGNKDRPETRRAFAIKCASYLQLGIGLVIVDVVTERVANLHDEMIELLHQPAAFRFPGEGELYAVAYRPARREPAGDQIDIWPARLTLGQTLPTMPLALRGGPTLPLDLETTYTQARQHSRL